MKKYFIFILLILSAVVFAGCQIKDNLTLQYGFSESEIEQPDFKAVEGGFRVELMLTDFSCQPQSFKANIGQVANIITLTLEGDETEQRCQSKFFAEARGFRIGDYRLNIVYNKNGQQVQIFSDTFTVY